MKICILSGTEIKNREMLHSILKDSLSLPEWYGRNLDALYDCLTEIQEITEIQVLQKSNLEKHLGRYANYLIKVIEQAKKENPRICLKLEE